MKVSVNNPGKGVKLAPIARGTSLEAYVRKIDPAAAGKSLSQLKAEAFAKTGIMMGASQG